VCVSVSWGWVNVNGISDLSPKEGKRPYATRLSETNSNYVAC